MATLNLKLSDDLKARAEARAAESGFATVEQYVEQLLRSDTDPPELIDEDLEKLLLERMNGPWVEMDAADWAQIRAKFEASQGDERGRQP
jgi:hypothetical protein